jgi:hypothetical protein
MTDTEASTAQSRALCEKTESGVGVMVAWQVAKLGGQAMTFPELTFGKRERSGRRGRDARLFGRRGPHHLDEALKAGIGATVCSVIILGLMLLVLQVFPLSIG